jgi:methionyl aminopeptidase
VADKDKKIYLKTDEELELIRVSGVVLGKTHAEVAKIIKPGVTTGELDKVAEEFIKDHKGKPSFKGFNGFPAALCISVNDIVVHGFPGKYVLKEGDIISVDCGVFLNGFHADSAYTYPVGTVKEEVKKLLDATKNALYLAIEQIKEGNRIGNVSFAIQNFVEKQGFSVVRELVGHGVGRHLHESPEVPNYGKQGQGLKLKEGMVLAIEPMINLGRKGISQDKDGWTIRTKDGKPSAHFEHTVAVRKNGKADVLTTFEYLEAVLEKK